MVAPDSQAPACLPSGRNSTYRPVQISGAGSYLVALNGFDEALWRAEDYELYLRIAQKYPIASHPAIVAEYRRHAQNVTNNHLQQLKAILRILDHHGVRVPRASIARVALKEGRASRRKYYVSRMLDEASVRWRANRDVGTLVRDVTQAAWWSPHATMQALFYGFYRRARKILRSILSGGTTALNR
jgi:hypothetical protein